VCPFREPPGSSDRRARRPALPLDPGVAQCARRLHYFVALTGEQRTDHARRMSAHRRDETMGTYVARSGGEAEDGEPAPIADALPSDSSFW